MKVGVSGYKTHGHVILMPRAGVRSNGYSVVRVFRKALILPVKAVTNIFKMAFCSTLTIPRRWYIY